MLEAQLIEKICDYWFLECYYRHIPLAPFTRICFATNGKLWFSKAAQHLIRKYHEVMSVTVSIDGVQKLHDKFRVDCSGIGSFSQAYSAFLDAKQYGWYHSKMTFIPSSFQYIFDSIKLMLNEGCEQIHCNCAFEPTYTITDAAMLYKQLCKTADYVIDHGLDVYISILDETAGMPVLDDQNFCGGTGAMLSFAPDGKAYPCIRYAPISIGKEKAKSVCLGDCYHGLYITEHQQKLKAELDAITKSSQSPQKCLDCAVASGCGWCSGYNYECFGTANKRSTNICLAHKARVLACCYYYNKRHLTIGDCLPKHIYLPFEEAVQLIGELDALQLFHLEASTIK